MLKKQEINALYVPDAVPAVFELGFDRPFSLDSSLAAELPDLKTAGCVRFAFRQEVTGNRVDINRFTGQLEADLLAEAEDLRLNRPVTVAFHQKLNENLVSVRRKNGILTYKLYVQGMDADSLKKIEEGKDIEVLLQDDRVAFPYCKLKMNDKITVKLTQKALFPDGTSYGFFIKYTNLSGLLHGRCCSQDVHDQLKNLQPLDVYVWDIKPNGKISVGVYPKETYSPGDAPAGPGETIEAEVIAHFFWAILTRHKGRYYILSTATLPGRPSYATMCRRYPLGAILRVTVETEPDPGIQYPVQFRNTTRVVIAEAQEQPAGRMSPAQVEAPVPVVSVPKRDGDSGGDAVLAAATGPVEAMAAADTGPDRPVRAAVSGGEPVVHEGTITGSDAAGLVVASAGNQVAIPCEELAWNAFGCVTDFFRPGDSIRFVLFYTEKGEVQGSVRRLHADPFPVLEPGAVLSFEVKTVRSDGLTAVAGGLMLFLPREACLRQDDGRLEDEYVPGQRYSGRLEVVDAERRSLIVVPKAFLPDPCAAGLAELPFVDAEITEVRDDCFLLKYDRFYLRLTRAEFDWNRQVGAFVTPELCPTVRVRVVACDAATGTLTATARRGDDPFPAFYGPDAGQQVVYATVEREGSGGMLAVYNGIRFFLPADEISWLVLDENTRYRPGETIPVRIVRYSKEERWLEATGKIHPINPAHTILLGKKLVVTVRRVDPCGLLVGWDEGMRAYIYMESLSWQRNDNWQQDYKTGGTFPARLVDFKTNQKKINQLKLSVKVLKEPARQVPFRSGEIYTACVLCDTPHRLYVDVDGFYGIVNHQEVDWIGRYKFGSKFRPGDTFDCRLLEADLQKGSLKFSRKATLPSPVSGYRAGQTVSGTVYALYPLHPSAKKAGIVVDDCIYAYLDNKHVRWEKEVDLNDCLTVGAPVTATICAINSQTSTLYLSLLDEPPYSAGQKIKGAVVDSVDIRGNIRLKSPEGVCLFIASADKESMNRLPMKYLGKRYITKGEKLDVTVESVDLEHAFFVVSLR